MHSMGRVPKKHGNHENSVKKGPWSAEEDQKLVAYVMRYGIWNWNQMPKPAGLLRTGKSCRLRWMNYLRPDIRHGNITKEEEEIIIKWHRLLGNRWSAIATKLPGRTDNEVKNYWNTRLKKHYYRSNTHTNAVNPPQFQTTSEYGQKSIQSNGISITPVFIGSAQEYPLLRPNETMSYKALAGVTNDFCSSNSPYSSSNDMSPLGLDDDQLQTLLMQMFLEEEDTYMALNAYYHEKSGHTSTLVASQDIDGGTDVIDDFMFDLWKT